MKQQPSSTFRTCRKISVIVGLQQSSTVAVKRQIEALLKRFTIRTSPMACTLPDDYMSLRWRRERALFKCLYAGSARSYRSDDWEIASHC